jgi:single-strand DNA-binding protein
MNRVILCGNVGSDPETRNFSNGGSVVSFSLAVSDKWRDKSSGELKERTEWFQIQCFNDHVGKIIKQYVLKGNKVLVEGSFRSSKYKDKEGVTRKSFDVVISAFDGKLELLGSKQDRDEAPHRDDRAADEARKEYRSQLDDDIPF